MLYELLTGAVPFSDLPADLDPAAVGMATLDQEIELPEVRCWEVTEVLVGCFEKEPEDRWDIEVSFRPCRTPL